MPRRVPDKQGIFSLETGGLFGKQAVIRCKTRQKYQLRLRCFCLFFYPVVNASARSQKCFMFHRYPPWSSRFSSLQSNHKTILPLTGSF